MCTLFLYTQLYPRLAVPKICMIFQVFCCFLLIFSKIFYNARNRRNDKTGNPQEKTTCFNAHCQYSQSKITGLK